MKTVPRNLVSLSVSTPDGIFTAHYSERGLAGINFPSKQNPAATREPENVPTKIQAWHRLTSAALKRVVAGEAPGKFPPFDLSAGTEFQCAVWQAMLQIQSGQAKSYGEIAQAIGKPKAVRAVGGACGANPIPVLVPCHRVIAAGGKIGGFSSDMNWKRTLLKREGVIVS
ncbi:MAG: methylated-DNA--[protein]-cysteine S-methyltransferase [Verrucomicrobia bacterium]|nr:MAG: methylated-DNA--[protein]-cysteine S-methyltransferase [Verrucomicrobiota bacterium]